MGYAISHGVDFRLLFIVLNKTKTGCCMYLFFNAVDKGVVRNHIPLLITDFWCRKL